MKNKLLLPEKATVFKAQSLSPTNAGNGTSPLIISSAAIQQQQSSKGFLQSNAQITSKFVTVDTKANQEKTISTSTLQNSTMYSSLGIANSSSNTNNSQGGSQSANMLSGITDQHKQLIKQSLAKNAHKPQTKAILDKFLQNHRSNNNNKANSFGTGNNFAANENGNSSKLAVTGSQSLPIASSVNQVGGSSQVNINKCTNETNNIVQTNSHIFNSTTSSQQSTSPFHQVSNNNGANNLHQNSKNLSANAKHPPTHVNHNHSQIQQSVVFGVGVKKKFSLDPSLIQIAPALNNNNTIIASQVANTNGTPIQHQKTDSQLSQNSTHRSNSNPAPINAPTLKTLSRSSSMQKIMRDTMYRFTMYQPQGTMNSQNSIVSPKNHALIDASQTNGSGYFGGAVVNTNNIINVVQKQDTQKMQVIGDSKPLTKTPTAGDSNGFNKWANKQKNHPVVIKKKAAKKAPLADKVMQQNAILMNSKNKINITKKKIDQQSPLPAAVQILNTKNQLSAQEAAAIRAEAEARKSKEIEEEENYYIEKDNANYEESIEKEASSSQSSARSTQDFFFSKKQKEEKINQESSNKKKSAKNQLAPLPPKLSHQNKQKSAENYMFTLGINDEEAFKRAAGATGSSHKQLNPVASHNNFKELTPSSSSAGATTTMGQSFSNVTSSIPQKKRSIFSENHSMLRGLHDETFAFSASKHNIVVNIANTEESNQVPVNSTQEKWPLTKNMYSKYCELRISSPRFRLNNNQPSSNDTTTHQQLSSNRIQTREGSAISSSFHPPSSAAMKDYCEQVIEWQQQLPSANKVSYSQLMLQTFAKFPQQPSSQTLSATYNQQQFSQYHQQTIDDQNPDTHQLLEKNYHRSLQQSRQCQIPPIHGIGRNLQQQQQSSFTSLPRIKNQSAAEVLTPLHHNGSNSVTNDQKRAFSVNFKMSGYNNFQTSPSPSNVMERYSSVKDVNRPTSSLISKKSGLPQVFLEKYKKNPMVHADHFSTNSKGVGGFHHDASPFPHPLESLTLQKRHLSSAECIINRPAFSEHIHNQQPQLFRGESQQNHHLTSINGSIFSGGPKALKVPRISSCSQGNAPFLGTPIIEQQPSEDTVENVNPQMIINSVDLRNQLALKKEYSAGGFHERMLEAANYQSPAVDMQSAGTPFQQSIKEHKPPVKRIQTSTQEIRQRKPVISKKFFRKIFANSPEPKQSMASAECCGGSAENNQVYYESEEPETVTCSGNGVGGVFSPQDHGAAVKITIQGSGSQSTKNNAQPRYQQRPNNESVVSNSYFKSSGVLQGGAHFQGTAENCCGNRQYQINIEPPQLDEAGHDEFERDFDEYQAP